ncbi:MAG: methyltransferase domain-containing protein [Candidatus Aminicenantes bacterium]|nr:methyltransferase domain-containing protein [Candidatus Aminicenantes bacterium]
MPCAGTVLGVFAVLWALNQLSYRFLKARILKKREWGLNICCGKTDGGGVNADIVRHADVPRFQCIEDIYRLPFRNRQFDSVLCSHTLEHVEDPDRFYDELCRVGRQVVLVLPPLWDISAVLNFFEHRWIFLTFKKVHERPPRRIRLPLARALQQRLGQRIHS